MVMSLYIFGTMIRATMTVYDNEYHLLRFCHTVDKRVIALGLTITLQDGIFFTLQMRKLRLGEITPFAPNHTATEGHSSISTQDMLTAAVLLFHLHYPAPPAPANTARVRARRTGPCGAWVPFFLPLVVCVSCPEPARLCFLVCWIVLETFPP